MSLIAGNPCRPLFDGNDRSRFALYCCNRGRKSRDLLTIKRAAAIQEWLRMAYAELLKFFYVVYKFRDATS
jgi:hypothetical protein